jgi:gliding motility-associated-like protein
MMRRWYIGSLIIVLLLVVIQATAQDHSNKGKEFWLCFPAHVPTGTNTLANMSLFITSDKNSSGKVTVNGFTQNFTVTANQVSPAINIPYPVAYISNAESGSPVNKGIHVQVDDGKPPVVVFAHVYADKRSEATLVLPVSVLGKKYYSMNFYQAAGNIGNAKSQFAIVATEPQTTVRYRLRKNGISDVSSTTILLPAAGDVLQVQDALDLSGSVIESVSPDGKEGCKKIAVFSGSSAISIKNYDCTSTDVLYASSDPLMQQCYAVNTWGNKYAMVPFAANPNGYHPRVMASEDNTVIDFAGLKIVLNAGEYFPVSEPYPFPLKVPVAISANKPIAAAQFMMSAYCAGNVTNYEGDADMVILNPVEQNIKDISLFSSNLESINEKYLNVYMPTVATASFKINGSAPSFGFAPMVPANGYSWLIEPLPLAVTAFRLTADSGFNATAYGLGRAESYAYSAGSYVKDKYQFLSIGNQGAIINRMITCKGAPFNIYMTFPYQPLKITWHLGGMQADVMANNPVPESTSVQDGKTLYRYKLATTVTAAATGTYSIGVTAVNPTIDGCGGIQEILYDLEVIEPPVAAFTFSTGTCNSQQLNFTYTGTSGGLPVTGWRWNFDDGIIATDIDPAHTFIRPAAYKVGLYTINEIGCYATVAEKIIKVDTALSAGFKLSASCAGQAVVFTNTSILPGGYLPQTVTWDFGDATSVTSNNMDPVTHEYKTANPFTVKLVVQTTNGCSSGYSAVVSLDPLPVLSFTPVKVCLPDGKALFHAQSNVAVSGYQWSFGDGGTASGSADVTHAYGSEKVYEVILSATSDKGCTGEVKQLVTVVPAPVAGIDTDATEVFAETPVNFTNTSAAVPAVQQYIWDFGDGIVSTQATNGSQTHIYKTVATVTTVKVQLQAKAANGCTATAQLQLMVKPPLQIPAPAIPNIFSPNGDGVHDYWDILYLDRYTQVVVKVFNRWGQLVYTSKGYDKPWDGRSAGKPLPAGSYYYIIETGGSKISATGAVTIIR